MSTNNVMQKVKFSVSALSDTVLDRATKGILFLVINDSKTQGLHTYTKLKLVTDEYDDTNKAFITAAFSDYKMKTVIVASAYDESGISGSLSSALALLNKVNKNGWLTAPQVTTDEDKKKVADFIKAQRNDEDYPLKGVLHNCKAENEGVVNFTGEDLIDQDDKAVSSDEFCLDVAAILCTLGANEAITNYTATRIKACDTKDDNDTHVANGELFLYNDGDNIVFSTGVNSLTTIPTGQSNCYSKIRVIEVIDMTKSDLNTICKKKYLGKFGNSYNNRVKFVNDGCDYLDGSREEGYLSNDTDDDGKYSYMELNVEKTKEYLESSGVDTTDMKDIDILKHKLDTHVFVKVYLHVMDVMETIDFDLQYDE